jgi:sigma-B regulation protein RsbU (phosphoserine phosphatase)
MSNVFHLDVRDVSGDRRVAIDHNPFTIGRRETNNLRLGGGEVSREHAEIVRDGDRWLIRDRASRYGTFVNDQSITECGLKAGDKIRLGRGGGADLAFNSGDPLSNVSSRSATGGVGDLRQVAALLEGLRALGTGRVLHDVLALVLDTAIDISSAERGFIMLAGGVDGKDGVDNLEFKLARGRGRQTLGDVTFETSRKIPEAAFKTGETQIVADLLDSAMADVHAGTVALGIRHVLCAPLHLVRYVDDADARSEDRRIGVLYLDSREKGTLLSTSTRSALETLATEAAVAIENARLYREAAEKARLEQEIRIAAEIQSALLPKLAVDKVFVEAAASTVACRSIGGDFFDYADQATGHFAFTLGDVAGKGPPAALLSALLQGMFSVEAQRSDPPAEVVSRVNCALFRRGIESRFATLFFGVVNPAGELIYCNAGHNPPFVLSPGGGARRLEAGGPVVGLLNGVPYDEETVHLKQGDRIVVFSDGVSEALNRDGDEFGDERLLDAINAVQTREPEIDATHFVEEVIKAVRVFTAGAPQSDDITAMIVRYRGMPA